MKQEKVSRMAHRFMSDTGRIMGYAILLNTGRWRLEDKDGKRMSPVSFETPEDAGKALQDKVAVK